MCDIYLLRTIDIISAFTLNVILLKIAFGNLSFTMNFSFYETTLMLTFIPSGKPKQIKTALCHGLNWKLCLSLGLTNETFIGQLSFSGSQTCEQNLSLSLCGFKGILIRRLIARYHPVNAARVPIQVLPRL